MEKKKETKKVASKTAKKKTVPTKKTTKTTVKNTSKKKKKKGFTLIELLAVIIILGILMIIAIPSVTRYISDSRKSAYIDTAKQIVSGARNIVNEGKLGMYDTDTTYYIPAKFVNTENSLKSPYGEFTEAYVGVIYDGQGYKYYWISVDDAGQGVKNITLADKLDTDDIVSDLRASDITNVVEHFAIGNRSKIKIYDIINSIWMNYDVQGNVSEEGGVAKVSLVPSCPDCVFYYTDQPFYATWNTVGATPKVFESGEYSDDYRDVVEDEVFLGIVLNSNNQAERVYACGIENGTPFCVEGSSNGAKYSANQSVIISIFGSTDTSGSSKYVDNNENGHVMVYDRASEWFCAGFDDEKFYCGM